MDDAPIHHDGTPEQVTHRFSGGGANLADRSSPPPLKGGATPLHFVLAGVIAYVAVVGWLFRDLRHDDAYITFRYGQNVVLGRGLAFNPGQRVLGTTSPLQTLLSIPIYAAARDATHAAANVLGVAAVAASSLLFYWIVRTYVAPAWAWAVAAGSALGIVGQFLFLGLETNLVLALVLGTFCLALRERHTAAGIILALAYLARPDSVVAAPSLLLIAWMRKRRLPWRPVLAFALIAGAWHVFAWCYFGVFFTSTLEAKKHATTFDHYLTMLWTQYRNLVAYPYIEFPEKAGPLGAWANLLVVPLAIGAWRWVTAGPVAAALLLYPVLLVLGYAGIGPPTDQLWHTVPAAAFGLACLVLGLGWIGQAGVNRLHRAAPGTPPPVWAAALVVAFLAGHAIGAVQLAQHYRDMYWYGQRDRKYTAIAEDLRRIVPPNETILTWEVGTLAFKSDRLFIDGLGLVSPGIRGIGSADGSIPRTPLTDVVREHDPRWVLILRNQAERNPEWFRVGHAFRHHSSYPAPPFASFELFERRDARR